MDLQQIMDALTKAIEQNKASNDALRQLIEGNAETAKSANAGIEALKGTIEQIQLQHEELRKSVIEQATKNARPNLGGDEVVKSVGERFADHVSEFFQADESRTIEDVKKGLERLSVGSFFTDRLEKSNLSDLQSPIADDMRLPNIVFQPERQFLLRDIIPSFPTSMQIVEYIEETRFNVLAGQLTAQAAALQADLVVNNINGYFVGQTVTVSPGTAKEETGTIASLTTPTEEDPSGTITLDAALANTHEAYNPGSSYDEGLVVSDNFAFTPQAHLKPAAEIKFEVKSEKVKTLAHGLPVTTQMLEDHTMLRAHIDMRLLQGLQRVEERHILYGAGNDTELQGILTHADVQTYAWSSGLTTPVPDTKLDAIRRAMTLVQLANYPADAVVLHPTDWEEVETSKGTDGHYIWTNVPGAGAGPVVWRMPVVVTQAIAAGDGLIGAFSIGCALYDRRQSSVRVFEQHKDFAARNMVYIRAEERIVLLITNPESFVSIDFDAAPA